MLYISSHIFVHSLINLINWILFVKLFFMLKSSANIISFFVNE